MSTTTGVTEPSAAPPARFYVGTDTTQILGAKILEYSIRKHSSIPVEVDYMLDVTWPFPKDPKNQPGTHFSFHRFAIPERAGYTGRAIYVDADMLVLRDPKELWELPFNGATVMYAAPSNPKKYGKQFSVMLLDCGTLTWKVDRIITEGLDAGKFNYNQLMKELCIEPAERVREGIPAEWNSLELYEPGKTGLIHYTNMKRQPWLNAQNRNGHLWLQYLKDALADGWVTRAEVEEAQAKGWARPSLLKHLDAPPALWPVFKVTAAPLIDRSFQPHSDLEARKARVNAQGAAAAGTPGTNAPTAGAGH
jgi:hypothetical protein